MIKRYLVIGIILLFVFLSFNPSFAVDNVKKSTTPVFDGSILYVGGLGPGNYSSIQGAINDANPGDTVFVYDDSSPYYERLVLSKNITLVGEDRDSTVVDAQHIGSVVKIYADGSLVSGFTLKNCQMPPQGYEFGVVKIIDSDNVIVSDNILSIGENVVGPISAVELYDSCYCNVSGNVIFELDKVSFSSGVFFSTRSCYNTVSGNIISRYVNGIRFEWYGGCEGNMIIGNHISNCTDGVEITGCNNNKMMNNTIDFNDEGIRLSDVKNTVISGNVIQFNGIGYEFDCGIELVHCLYDTISGNVISNNNPTGIYVVYAFDNVISKNNFIGNYGFGGTPKKWWGNAYFCVPFRLKSLFGANSWDGNFWSDYKGFGKKRIPGDIEVIGYLLKFGWFQFDRYPAKEPYDI